MRKLLILSLLAVTANAYAANMALIADTDAIKVKIAPLPGDAKNELNLVGWEGGHTEAPTGTMVYKGGNSPPRDFISVGLAGPFTIHDSGNGTMVKGSLVPAMNVHFKGSKDPVLVKVSGAKVDAAELFKAYSSFQGHGAAGATKEEMQKRIDEGLQAYRAACGTAKANVDWSSFEKGKAVAWAGSAYGAFMGLAALCSAKADYQAEIKKIATYEIGWQDSPEGDIKIVRTPGKIKITLAHMAYNLREVVPAWAEKDF